MPARPGPFGKSPLMCRPVENITPHVPARPGQLEKLSLICRPGLAPWKNHLTSAGPAGYGPEQTSNLTSDFPISLKTCRTFPKDGTEIKEQIQNSLQAGFIKESCTSYSVLVIRVFKHENKKKTSLCVDFRTLNVPTKQMLTLILFKIS